MTDHKEEQSNEIEALESIYPDELEVLLTEPLHVFSIIITPTELEDTDQTANITVKFRYVENYPDEGPVFEITEYDNLDEEHIDTLNDVIKEQIEENIGMAMVFTIVSALQEKIAVIIEDRHQKELEEKQRAEREIEAAAQKKFEGTKVTVESFLAWKTMFEAEINEFKAKKLKENPEPKGLTGKELFLQDSKMDESDVIFLQSEDAGVEVDESLFQDIDDLDIEDDDLDIDDEAVD